MPQVGAGELIVYEVPLRTFTAHPNSNVGSGKQGTFLGFLDKVCSLHPAADSMHGRCAAGTRQAVQRATPSCNYVSMLLGQIPHLVDLGVTAVEILPVFEYDELEFQRSPNPRVLPCYLCMPCSPLHRKYVITASVWAPCCFTCWCMGHKQF